jgi:hypothetical protein
MRLSWRGVAVGMVFAAAAARCAWAQSMVAQNTYGGGAVPSPGGITTPADSYLAQNALAAAQAEVRASETNVSVSAGFMHTQYHEDLTPGAGDDENGFSAGGNFGASVLLPGLLVWRNADLYADLNLDVSAGNLTYGGHEENLLTGAISPASLTDRAVFIRFESRLGVGIPLVGGAEFIPFLAGGYQGWNRNIDVPGGIGTDEFYDEALLGGGLKLDVPVTSRLVISGAAEGLAMIAGNISYDSFGENAGLGGSAQERLSLGADYSVSPHFHVVGSGFWEHFNYAGNKFTSNKTIEVGDLVYEISEPVSTTTQFGVNLGIAYSF